MKKQIILVLILTFFSNHLLISQNPDNKVKTEKKDSIKSKKKKALLPLKPERKIKLNIDEEMNLYFSKQDARIYST